MNSTLLYCTVLYCTVLYCTVSTNKHIAVGRLYNVSQERVARVTAGLQARNGSVTVIHYLIKEI